MCFVGCVGLLNVFCWMSWSAGCVLLNAMICCMCSAGCLGLLGVVYWMSWSAECLGLLYVLFYCRTIRSKHDIFSKSKLGNAGLLKCG